MPPDTESRFLIELQRLAGALEGVEVQLACLCQHFGALPQDGRRKRAKRARGEK